MARYLCPQRSSTPHMHSMLLRHGRFTSRASAACRALAFAARAEVPTTRMADEPTWAGVVAEKEEPFDDYGGSRALQRSCMYEVGVVRTGRSRSSEATSAHEDC